MATVNLRATTPPTDGAEPDEQPQFEGVKLTKYSGKKVGWTIRVAHQPDESWLDVVESIWRVNDEMERAATAHGYTFE